MFGAVSEDCLMSQQWLDKRVTGVSRTFSTLGVNWLRIENFAGVSGSFCWKVKGLFYFLVLR